MSTNGTRGSGNEGEDPAFAIRSVAVVGCGLMGCGIAEVAALAGLDVVAIKATAGDAGPVRGRIAKSLERAVQSGRVDDATRDAALSRLRVSNDLDDARDAELIIESAIEAVLPKKRLLSELEGLIRPDAIIATNTS